MSLPTESNPSSNGAFGTAIEFQNVSIRYTVPHERITTFKEYAIRRIKREIYHTELWALNNVSLTVKRGETLGVIGPNGAGKSTLLKVIARVLRPTQGRVQIWGNVSPMLELGTGFDYELSGRENIYLNSAILGFDEKNVAGRFDRMVEFAELGEFIDAPLRTYSTGMVARLGFAIATDVAPDILLVDEVLSVGDAIFKQKSSDRMTQFYEQGKTIVLVTHSLETVTELCQQAIWLEKGQVRAEGETSYVIKEYLASTLRAK